MVQYVHFRILNFPLIYKNLQAVHFNRKNDDWPFDLGTSDLYGYVYARPALRWDRNLAI